MVFKYVKGEFWREVLILFQYPPAKKEKNDIKVYWVLISFMY